MIRVVSDVRGVNGSGTVVSAFDLDVWVRLAMVAWSFGVDCSWVRLSVMWVRCRGLVRVLRCLLMCRGLCIRVTLVFMGRRVCRWRLRLGRRCRVLCMGWVVRSLLWLRLGGRLVIFFECVGVLRWAKGWGVTGRSAALFRAVVGWVEKFCWVIGGVGVLA